MNYPINIRANSKALVAAMIAVCLLLLTTTKSSAQITNAYDVASDPAYPTGDLLATNPNGGQNGGFGFGAWIITVGGTGGAFIQDGGPSGKSFDIWNTAANSSTIAVRPFNSPLVPGQSFSVQLRLNSLDNSGTTNALWLRDASGNTLFSYWHVGFEPNGAVNGHYTDAATTNGAAVGFSYNYQQFCAFTFTLNSSTNYTFTDNTTGHTFTGVINGSIAQVAFFRGSQNATGGGQDFQFDMLQIVSASPPTFSAQSPGAGSFSGSRTNVSVQVIDGSAPVATNTILFQVDGSTVMPAITKSGGVTTINYSPATPLSAGTGHTVSITLADANANSFTNTWSFTTGFPSLPAVLAGPIVASNQESGIVIFSAAGDAWVGANYGSTSSKTIYARFSVEFDNLNGETGDGGGYGGLQFILGGLSGTQNVIAGNAWASTNWSVDPYPAPQTDLLPVTPVVFHEWHTIVERIDYAPGGNALINVWLDPDFTQTEAGQPNPPVTVSTGNTFDTIALRTGNGTTSATFSNIVMAATSADVGFAAPAAPQFQNLIPAANAASAAVGSVVSAQVVFGTYSIDTNNVVLTLDGNTVTPSFAVTANTITVNYQPPAPFVASSSHSVTLSVTDANGTPYSISWNFNVDAYPTLPVTVAGPIDVSGGGLGVSLFGSTNGWLSDNYQAASTNTLYTRFSMTFYDLNGESADDVGGCFGGLHFYQDNNERLLTGETWLRNTWSVDDKAGGEGGEISLPPPTVIVPGEWHTLVIKSVYASNALTTETIWLDPDFTKSESNQPQAPLSLTMDNTFNRVNLRCGNGSAFAEFNNIMIAATAPEVGFAVSPPAVTLDIQNSGGSVNLSWAAAATLQTAPTPAGPWTDAANQANPQIISTTNAACFYRLRQ